MYYLFVKIFFIKSGTHVIFINFVPFYKHVSPLTIVFSAYTR